MRFESRVGTPAWMAPEVLNGDEYQFSAGTPEETQQTQFPPRILLTLHRTLAINRCRPVCRYLWPRSHCLGDDHTQ